MTAPERSTGLFVAAIGLLFWTIMGTASAVVFGVLYAAMIQLLAFGGVIFWVLVLGAYAGAIGGPVFGIAYWSLFVRHLWPGRLRAALCAGALGTVIFALLGIGFLVWESSERSHQPTMHPRLVPNSGEVAKGRSGGSYSGGVIVIEASPDGGRVIEEREPASDVGRSFKAFFMTAGVTGAGGFLYGLMFGAIFGRGHRSRRVGLENTESQRTQSSR